jgi:hypothetical protein
MALKAKITDKLISRRINGLSKMMANPDSGKICDIEVMDAGFLVLDGKKVIMKFRETLVLGRKYTSGELQVLIVDL